MKRWKPERGPLPSIMFLCLQPHGRADGMTVEGGHGFDWEKAWKRVGPDVLEIDGLHCSFRFEADGQTLRVADCANLTGQWQRRP